MDNAVKMIVLAKKDQGEPEEFDRWTERMKKYKEWVNGHRVQTVKAGDKIDVNDTENIWCRATVELVIKTQSRQNLLYLHYEGCYQAALRPVRLSKVADPNEDRLISPECVRRPEWANRRNRTLREGAVR